jgi:hypothetical protein
MCKLISGLFALLIPFCMSSAFAKEKGIDATITGQSGLFYKPNDIEPGTYTFKVDDTVVERPALWGLSAKLDQDLVIPTSKGDITVASGTVMPALTVSGVPGVGENMILFCTVRRGGLKGDTNFGFGATRDIWDSTKDGQICVLDNNDDGKTDYGFLINSGSRDDRIPKKIENLSLNIEELRPAGEGYKIKILLWLLKPTLFHLDIYYDGKKIGFNSISADGFYQERNTTLPKNYTFPYDVNIFGTKFRIISYDWEKRTITLDFSEKDRDLLISIPTRTVTSFRFY